MATKGKLPPTVARRTSKLGIPLTGRKLPAALVSDTAQLPDTDKIAEFESARSARLRASGRDPTSKTARRAVHLAAVTDEQKRENAQFAGFSGDPWNVPSPAVAAAFNSGQYDLNGALVPWRDIAHAENVSSVLRSLISSLGRNSTADPYMTEEQFKSSKKSALTMLNASPDPGETLLWLFVNAGDEATIGDKIAKLSAKQGLRGGKAAAELKKIIKGWLANNSGVVPAKIAATDFLDALRDQFKFIALTKHQDGPWKGAFELPQLVTARTNKSSAADKKRAVNTQGSIDAGIRNSRKDLIDKFTESKSSARPSEFAGMCDFVSKYFAHCWTQPRIKILNFSYTRKNDDDYAPSGTVIGLNITFEEYMGNQFTRNINTWVKDIQGAGKK